MFKKWAFGLTKRYLINKFTTEEYRQQLITYINKKVDLPKLTEKEEKALFTAMIDATIAFLRAL